LIITCLFIIAFFLSLLNGYSFTFVCLLIVLFQLWQVSGFILVVAGLWFDFSCRRSVVLF